MRDLLISIGQFCDHGYTAIFKEKYYLILYNHKVIMSGTCNHSTNYLWNLELHTQQPDFLTALDLHTNQPEVLTAQINSTTRAPSATPAERVIYGHSTMFSPAISTLETALDKGFLPQIPGLTKASIKAHPPQTVAPPRATSFSPGKINIALENLTLPLSSKSQQTQTTTHLLMPSHRPSPLEMPPIAAIP
jgi:hypothetical protein